MFGVLFDSGCLVFDLLCWFGLFVLLCHFSLPDRHNARVRFETEAAQKRQQFNLAIV